MRRQSTAHSAPPQRYYTCARNNTLRPIARRNKAEAGCAATQWRNNCSDALSVRRRQKRTANCVFVASFFSQSLLEKRERDESKPRTSVVFASSATCHFLLQHSVPVQQRDARANYSNRSYLRKNKFKGNFVTTFTGTKKTRHSSPEAAAHIEQNGYCSRFGF